MKRRMERKLRAAFSVRCSFTLRDVRTRQAYGYEFADLGNDRRKEVLATAYKQLLLNQVTDLVKASAEAYRQDNEQM